MSAILFWHQQSLCKKIHQNKTILAIVIKMVSKCTATNALIQEQRVSLKNSCGLLQSEVS